MTLLSIIQDACDEIGLERPTTIVGNTDPQVRQLLRACTQEGRYLAKAYIWEVMKKEGSFTTVATESQGAMTTIASDFDRFSNNTMWNRSTSDKLFGPLSDVQWQRVNADVTQGVTDWFRIRGGNLLIYPTATAGESVYFEYVSTDWVDTGTGASPAVADGSAFDQDENTVVFDDELMTLGTTYRWLKGRSLDYGAAFDDYRERLEIVKVQDGAKPNIDMGGVEYGYLGVNVPESGYGA